MAKATPLQVIKKDHGTKAALIDTLLPLIEADPGESAEDHKARLRHVANKKLLHLLHVGQRVQALGGRAAIVTKILEIKRQPKDHEFRDKLMRVPLPRLLDLLHRLSRSA